MSADTLLIRFQEILANHHIDSEKASQLAQDLVDAVEDDMIAEAKLQLRNEHDKD